MEYVVAKHPGDAWLVVAFALLALNLASYLWNGPPKTTWSLELNAYKAATTVIVAGLIGIALLRVGFPALFSQHYLAHSAWMLENWHAQRRLIVVALIFVLCIGVTLFGRNQLGFIYSGVRGWTYASSYGLPPADCVKAERCVDGDFASSRPFAAAIRMARFTSYLTNGFVEKEFGFLGFPDGTWHPFGVDLIPGTSPTHIARRSSDNSLTKIVCRRLALRQRGRLGLLPRWMGLTDHVGYLGYQYSAYPDSSQLQQIEFWIVRTAILPEHNPQIRFLTGRVTRTLNVNGCR